MSALTPEQQAQVRAIVREEIVSALRPSLVGGRSAVEINKDVTFRTLSDPSRLKLKARRSLSQGLS